MPESSPTSEVPQAILDNVTEERNIAGFSVRRVDKTGSSLHILGKGENKGIVRNAEILASSMAVWEFLHTYAQTLFPKEISQRLFGPWGRPQVAPILERKGKNRVYYSMDGAYFPKEKAAAYSKMVGFDTQRLTELWQITEVVKPYYYQNWLPREPRCLDCTSYHLAKDVFADVPSLDPTHKVTDLLDQYWNEFTQLNQNRIGRQDLLSNKELRRQDMDTDDAYQSSLKLVETGHTITGKLVEIYRNLEQSGQDILWKDKPVKEMLLLLTHLYQTSTQQSILWWLGVAHGHLHSFNTVSHIPNPDSTEAQISPLITSIIDFDAARVSADKLALNDELFASVRGEELKVKLKDQNLNHNVRLQLMFYLPLEQWDEENIQFVQQSNSRVKDELVKLISLRVSKDIHVPEKYTRFANFVYGMEKQNQNENYPAFGLTLPMLLSKPELIQPENQDLTVIADYYKNGEFPASGQTQLSQEQKLLLLSAIYQYRKGNKPYEDVPLSSSEIRFAITQLRNQDKTGRHAEGLLEMATWRHDGKTIPQLFQSAQNGKQDDIDLAKEVMIFYFSQNTETDSTLLIQGRLINSLVENKLASFALRLVDLKTLPRDTAILTYRNLRETLDSSYVLEDEPQEKTRLLTELDKQAGGALGKLFMFAQKARKILRREKK